MPATLKKCFVISPLGDDNSDIRREADAILWVARKALEKFDFEVIRVDEIARATVITTEIVQLIQESDLCLIVLTGQNANVFYEAGRRHETGKPFIQLIRRGDHLPFDVAGIRTIIYDPLDSLESAAKTISAIEKFVGEFEQTGYGTSGTGISMSTIALALDRIERKVGALMPHPGTGAQPGPVPTSSGTVGFVRNPRQTFMTAIAQGDIDKAAALLPRLEKLMGPSGELVAAAGMLSSQGYEPAAEIVYRLVVETYDLLKAEGLESLKAAVASLCQFYIQTDREAEGRPRIEPLVMRVVEEYDGYPTEQAFLVNQLAMVCYGEGDYQRTLELEERVVELAPSVPAYLYNNTLTLAKLGLTNKAIETVDRYMALPDVQPAHLQHAVEAYVEVGRIEDARRALSALQAADAGRAAVVLFDDDVRKALGFAQ